MNRSVLRSLWRQPIQIVGILVLLSTAVLVYAGTFMGLNQVDDTTRGLYRDTRMFDLDVNTAPMSPSAVPSVEELMASTPGVRDASWRLTFPAALTLSDGNQVRAMVIAVEPSLRPEVCDVLLTDGSFLNPEQPNGVVIDRMFATDAGLQIGSKIELRAFGQEGQAVVVGIGVFPEFLVSLLDADTSIPARKSISAVLMNRQVLTAYLPETDPTRLMAGMLLGLTLPRDTSSLPVNSLVIRLAADAEPEATKGAILAALDAASVDVVGSIWRKDHPNVWVHQARINNFRGILPAIVLVFNGMAFLSLILLIRRMVLMHKGEMATLLGLGVSRATVVLGWLGAVLLVLAPGLGIGATGAYWLAARVSDAYMEGTGFPVMLSAPRAEPIWSACAISLVFVIPGVILPILAALRQWPVQILRDSPTDSRILELFQRLSARFVPTLSMGIPEILGLRNVVRRPYAMLISVASIASVLTIASSLYLFSEAQIRSMADYLDEQRWDYLVSWVRPQSEGDAAQMLREAGAQRWESVWYTKGNLELPGASIVQSIIAYPVPSVMRLGYGLVEGHPISNADADELVVGLRLALEHDLHLGDNVSLSLNGQRVVVRIVGVANNYAFNQVYIGTQSFSRLLGSMPDTNGALLTGPPSVEMALSRNPNVAYLTAGETMKRSASASGRILGNFIRLYGHLGTGVGSVMIFVVIVTSVTDRAGEYALLRSLGYRWWELARMLLVEVAVLGWMAIAVSYPLTRLACWFYQQRIMHLGMWIPLDQGLGLWISMMIPAYAMMLLSTIPGLIQVGRVSAARSLQARSLG